MFFSFFIFNPLQELGNVIAVYNETKVSMDNFAKLGKLPFRGGCRLALLTWVRIRDVHFKKPLVWP